MYYRLPLNKELLVDVKIKPIKSASGDPMIRAIGIVYDANGHELRDVGRVTSKAQTAKNEQFAINDVLRQVEERYLKLYGTVPATEEDMQRAFDAVCNAVKNGLRLRPSWKAQSTNTQKLTHFARHGLPFLLQFANEHKRKFLPSDKQELEDMLIAAAMRQNVQGQSAKRTAEDRLWDYSIIYSHMRDQVERLPALQLEPSSITKRLPALEQVKHLDRTMLSSPLQVLRER